MEISKIEARDLPEAWFCCLGETLALSYINWDKNYAIGYLDLKLIDDISKIISKLNFRLANFQNPIEGEIKKHKINKIKDIINYKE